MKTISNFFTRSILMVILLYLNGLAQELATPGLLEVLSSVDESGKISLPLKHTSVKTEISGYIAKVEVKQEFHNDSTEKIEARYVFPLPENAAVNEMFMKIGQKVIYSEVKEKEAARKTYEQARDNGQRAALLEQERPNIFTQTVGNIMPGDSISIVIRFIQDLKYENGEYSYFFPTVVGPRYIPGNAIGKQAGGYAVDTDEVSDASRITPTVIPPGFRSGHDIDINVTVKTGTEISGIKSISHKVNITTNSPLKISLKNTDTIPNKDFILNYRVADHDPTTGILTTKKDGQGYFSMMINPPRLVKPEKVTPKELIFVVDCSGSMNGEPMTKVKAAMRHALQNLNDRDMFQIIKFSDAANGFSSRPVANNPDNIQKAMHFINSMHGTGGTQMIEGIKASLDYPETPGRLRIVVFMTDGYIGNETAIISAIKEKLGGARLFSFGIGSSVNRFLLEGMAEAGRGRCEYIPLREDTEVVVSEFYTRIRNPYWTDIKVDWGGLKVTEVYPQQIPDLFDNSPVLIVGKYSGTAESDITVTGKVTGSTYSQKLNINARESKGENSSLATVWARKKIKELDSILSLSRHHPPDPSLKMQIINLAVKFSLMSRFTSMVAVEREIIANADTPAKTVDIPVDIPEGINFNGVFGKASLSLTRVKPGDPVLLIDPPPNTVAVIAEFPFGLTESLQLEPEGIWSCRFLVPRKTKDGLYFIKVTAVCSDGERYEVDVPYTIDSKAPMVDVESELIKTETGTCLRIYATPRINDISETEAGIRSCIMADIRNIKVLDWKGRMHLLDLVDTEDQLYWWTDVELESGKIGEIEFTLQALDIAGNYHRQTVAVGF